MAHRTKRPWACRLAGRWFVDESQGLDQPGAVRVSILSRWARRHSQRCPQCRSEAADWARVEALLRRVDAPAAPPRLYPAVMARVAEAPRRGSDRGARARRARSLRTAAWAAGGKEFPVAGGAVLAGLLLVVGAVSIEPTIRRQVFSTVWSGSVLWWEYWLGVLTAVQADVGAAFRIFPSLPVGLRPYLSALVWSGVGLAVTAVLSHRQRWLRN